MKRDALAAPGLLASMRFRVVAGALAAGVLCAWGLGLGLDGLVPRSAGWEIGRDLLAAAFRPALTHEAEYVPPGAAPFLAEVARAMLRTVLFAAAAMGLAVPVGLALGALASDSWWVVGAPDGAARAGVLRRAVQWSVRLLIAAMRSVHELIWAVLFLAALGLEPASAAVAIAIPFAGALAKVGSEVLDEAGRGAWRALWAAGASPFHARLFGLFPSAAPDLVAYGFYRFECALRSAAVLGFFGHPTLGLNLVQSFENLHLREVWTYLYAMLLLALLAEAWSAAVRRRLVR